MRCIPARCGWLGLVLLLAGCGHDDGKLPQVQGRVFYRGLPLPGGTIVFTPDPDRGGSGPLACAEIGPDGHYTLHTGPRPGAVAGWHQVTVAPPAFPPQVPAGMPVPLVQAWPLPPHFCYPEQSGQCLEVKPDVPNIIDVHLE
jgi:hypothetical protein